MPISFSTGWTSRGYQDPFFMAMGRGIRRALLVWHRRGGKDISAWNWTIAEASRKTGVYYYFFPTFAQGRKAWWDGKDKDGKRYLEYIPFFDKCKVNEAEMKITFPVIEGGSQGSIIQIVGTDNYDSLMGTNPIGCVFSEYSLQNPGAWKFIRPILEENGGWAVFVMTPRGPNHGKKLYDFAKKSDKWYCSLLTIDDTTDNFGNPIITHEQIEEMREEGEDEAVIQQEWFCSFMGAQQGSYYSKQMRKVLMEGRICHVPHDPRYPVYVYADIGRSDHTVLGFVQYVGGWIHWINCLGETEQSLPYFASEINRLAREEGYQYGGFYWPHDMKVTEFGSGEQRVKVARRLGLNPSIVTKKHGRSEGIDAVRGSLARMKFDMDKTETLQSAMWLYRKEYDEEMKVFKNEPVHDWSSHFADMVRVQAMAPKATNRLPGMAHRYPEAQVAIYNNDPLGEDYVGLDSLEEFSGTSNRARGDFE